MIGGGGRGENEPNVTASSFRVCANCLTKSHAWAELELLATSGEAAYRIFDFVQLALPWCRKVATSQVEVPQSGQRPGGIQMSQWIKQE